MREGFDENGEPTLRKLDDYGKAASPEKRKAIIWVIVTGLILGVFYAVAKSYFKDVGIDEVDIPKDQRILHY
ncbi:MAG: hypothetical protein GXO19_04810 [Epsilonproteobacteria bacterium]|nr:hypothetical protein [Campylobacterota bacterium]NPA57040.1 hypothetical protein [Campylobacterota bacterium]